MKPKKRSTVEYILYGISLILILYLAIHAAISWTSIKGMIETGSIEKNEQITQLLQLFTERLQTEPLKLEFNEYTKKFLIVSGFAWFIFVLAIEGNRKNYIHGKEFGTARWATTNDLKDLLAVTIEKEEIKKAKKVRSFIGRWLVKLKIYKQCKCDGKSILDVKLKALKDEENKKKRNGIADRKLYKANVEKIKVDVEEMIINAKCQLWRPYELEREYEKSLEEIESELYSQKEREIQVRSIEKKYKSELNDFYFSRRKIEKIKAKYKDADMIFTQTERISFYNYKVNQNTLILGGSGSGKTRGYVIPNVLQAHSSYIITDPKGEILEKTGYFLKEIKNYKIRVLNLDDKIQSDGYNPFVYIHPERDGYEERVLSLIETIIINTDGGEKKGSSDPFWDKAERLFLQSIFFFTVDGFIEEERNMNTVLSLIAMLKIEEEEDKLDSDLDYFVTMFADRFGESHIGVQQFREFREKASGKTAKSIVISVVARLAPFRTQGIQKIFSYDTMELDMVGEEKTAIFVVVPPTDTTFNFIAGMMFTQLFQELQYCATQVHKHEGQHLPVPCRFILDEFANTCKIPNFVQILAYARSFGIGITPILQSLEQIKNMYKDEWGVIVDNCSTLLYLGSISHMDTLEYMSKLLGKGTFDKKTTGRTRGRQGSSSQNHDVVGRELMDVAEIRKLEKEKCLLVVSGRNPFYSDKYKYETHPNYRFTSDGNKAYSFYHKPLQPKGICSEELEDVNNFFEPSDRTKINIDKVEVDLSPQNMINRIVENFNNMKPILDEESMVGN